MKNLIYFLFAFALLSTGCEEIPPDVSPPNGGNNSEEIDVNLEDQPRQVLIEEFTGVRCVNCPEGSEQLETMLNTYGNQLVAVSIHAGFFSPPHNESLYDFRTDDGTAILNYLEQPIGFPTAVVDRKLFQGEASLQIAQSTWNGHVDEQLVEEPKIKIGIDPTFSMTDRNLTVDLTFLPTENLSNEDLRYTVMITENNIIDYQTIPVQGDIPDYNHKHVFRDVITTNFDGDPITEDILDGFSFEKSINYTLPENWDENECTVIAFVHYSSNNNKEVLQAAEVDLVN